MNTEIRRSVYISINMSICMHFTAVWLDQKYLDTYLYDFCVLCTHLSLRRNDIQPHVCVCTDTKNFAKLGSIILKINCRHVRPLS